MERSKIDLEYLSVGCNRVPHALDWAQNNGMVAFGAQNNVVLYDPIHKHRRELNSDDSIFSTSGRVVCSLRKHKDRVNCVSWVKSTSCPCKYGGNYSYSLCY